MTIYLITNLCNGKMYVGKTKHGLRKRWSAHKNSALAKLKNTPLARAIRRYGAGNFSMVSISECSTISQANNLEKVWIIVLRTHVSHRRGYNFTYGGDGSVVDRRPTSVCEKISMSLRGHIKSPETRLRLSRSLRGNKNANGRVLGSESRKKLSMSLKGNRNCKGCHRSPETKAKMSAAQKGRGLGLKQSPSTIASRIPKLVSSWSEGGKRRASYERWKEEHDKSLAERIARRRERNRLRMRTVRQHDPEGNREQQRRWRAANSEHRNRYMREWWAKKRSSGETCPSP